jgi:ParB/RepB/Spo0J family partition protein
VKSNRGAAAKKWRLCGEPPSTATQGTLGVEACGYEVENRLKIENYAIGSINPYENNPRVNKDAIVKVASSIQEFGFQQPIVIDKNNTIIVGHTRYLAAKRLNLKTVPVICARHLSDEQAWAYRIADNKAHEFSSWDITLLGAEFLEMQELNYDLDLTLFSDDEISKILNSEIIKVGDEAEEKLPELKKDPITKPGDIFILGKHKLICGDAYSFDTIDKLVKNEAIDLIYTDPMYNDNYSDLVAALSVINCDHILLMCTFKQGLGVLKNSDFRFRFDLVLYFKTPSSTMNKGVPYYLHKNIIYLTKVDKTIFNCNNAAGIFSENGYYPSVIEAKKNTQEAHGLTKPVDATIKILSGFKSKTVLDLFAGSGTTLMACDKLNRSCFCVEIDPVYCDQIIERWQTSTGQEAVTEEGITFSGLKQRRAELSYHVDE